MANHFPEPPHRRIIREIYYALQDEPTPLPDRVNLLAREVALHQLLEELEERLHDLQTEIQYLRSLERGVQGEEPNPRSQ